MIIIGGASVNRNIMDRIQDRGMAALAYLRQPQLALNKSSKLGPPSFDDFFTPRNSRGYHRYNQITVTP